MNVKEKAIALHGEGCNCAQSVLCSLEAYTNLPFETAKRVAEGFGGGVRCGEICGSITGAVMALGMVKEKPLNETVAKFVSIFREQEGCVRCQELLTKYEGKGNCNAFIGFCAEEMEKILQEE